MPQIVRRWLYDPGNTVLTQIEGVDIIDNTPPQQVIGVGTGLACIVGEFENGPFNVVTQVSSFTNLKQTFGTFGYTYGNTVGNNPCARQRFADGAVLAEYWNGNASVQLNGKAFAQLAVCRVNTSVGTVQFTRQANLLGGSQFRYSLTTGQTLAISVDGGGAVTATFTGVAATVTGTGAAFASITAGLSQTFTVDQMLPFAVVFQTGDTTIANVVARINAFAGFTFASNSGGQLKLTGIQAGTGGQIIVASNGAITTDLGLTPATTNGTGNVANISAVAPAEINTVVHTAVATVTVELLPTGQLRAYRTSATPTTDSLAFTVASTAANLGFPFGVTDAASTGNAGTIPAGTVVQVPSGNVYITMQDVNVTATVQTGVTPSGPGPYPVAIRFAQDDNSGSTVATAGTITQVTNPILLDSYACTNLLPTTASLTEAQIDAAYTTAILATIQAGNQVAQQINVLWSARQSNSVRNQMLQLVNNIGNGGGVGVIGRTAIIRPPIGTLAATAESSVSQPGVGAYTTERIIYCYPGVTTTVSAIQTVGPAGGTGFTIPGQAVGTASVGSDGFMASVLSQLPPEQNPGQLTTYTSGAVGFEVASNGVSVNNNVALQLQDYINFKANGIAAPTFSGGTAGVMQFQSGVTSVLYASFPSQAPIHRRRMADYIQDSLALSLQPFVKQLMTINRMAAATTLIRQFLIQLLSPTNSNQQRINGFFLDTKTPNLAPPGGVAPTTLGIWRATILVQTIPSMDDIVLDTTVGDTVNITLAN
jgi:hypothetical protein